MANRTRGTTAGRVYNDLRNLARRNSRSTDEVMVEYVLERFLYRPASSPLGREHFVLRAACCSPSSAHVE
ncbi:hypothetical protein ACFY6U_21890 [Streptomyces sp. NPDC013157]|uniref:hypothetical protein n=1 Tax=Streptomyces sp. NPDC013157 TaxID=3364861 RepID=UPI0036C0667B